MKHSSGLGGQGPGVEAITGTKMPPNCCRALHRLARFVRIHDLNSIGFYLPSRSESWDSVTDDEVDEIREFGALSPRQNAEIENKGKIRTKCRKHLNYIFYKKNTKNK